MDIATRDAPGVTSQWNWVTDIGGPVDPNSTNSMQLVANASYNGPYLFSFTLSTTYNAGDTSLSDPPMTFNRMGMLGGPLKKPDGSANVGGVVQLTLYQVTINYQGEFFNQLAVTTVDMTNAVPGQFYWSNPLPTPVNVWGVMYSGPLSTNIYQYPQTFSQFVYCVVATCPVPYAVYANRPVTLLNGVQWGSGFVYNSNPTANDHTCAGGPIDFNYNNFKSLGTASLAVNPALSSTLHRKSGLSMAGFSPQVALGGRMSRVGVFEGVSAMTPEVVLSATPMVGGALWKPSNLCTG